MVDAETIIICAKSWNLLVFIAIMIMYDIFIRHLWFYMNISYFVLHKEY
jgi:hypothetical protein